MEKNFIQASTYIEEGDITAAIQLLEAALPLLNEKKDQSTAYYLLGNAYRKCSDWQNAMNHYQQSIALHAESPAVGAKQMLEEILAFYNRDMYNH